MQCILNPSRTETYKRKERPRIHRCKQTEDMHSAHVNKQEVPVMPPRTEKFRAGKLCTGNQAKCPLQDVLRCPSSQANTASVSSEGGRSCSRVGVQTSQTWFGY